MPPRKINNGIESSHTRLGYILVLFAGIVELYLGISYLSTGAEADIQFGQLTLLEGIFALVSLVAIDPIMGKGFSLYPKKFKQLNLTKTAYRTLILLFVMIVIQILFQIIPLTVRDIDKALAIAFAGPAEEAFFRGFLMSVFIAIGQNMPKIEFGERAISFLEITGMAVSGGLFALLHVNYYGDISLMLTVFTAGIILAFFYWYWRDLTALILAHFALNVIVVFQTIGTVSF